MTTRSSTSEVTAPNMVVSWLSRATLVLILLSLMIIVHAMSGG
jgi:hypothetical protein